MTSSEPGAPPSSPGSEPTASPNDAAHPALQGPEPSSGLSEEIFRDPAEVLGMGPDVDYLEQFGTSQESALRKQSLFLKFDPLLEGSPERPAPAAPETISVQDTLAPSSGSPPTAKLVTVDLLGVQDLPVLGPAPCVLGPGDPLVDVLQYSQKGVDAAVQVEATEKENLQLRSCCEELHQEILEIWKMMDELKSLLSQTMEEAQKMQELAKAQIQEIQEQKQLRADNEESLRKWMAFYMDRIEKERHRAYQEIAKVQRKAEAEELASQARLRQEQMRVHWLEKDLEQKNKDNSELISICEELAARIEKA